MSLCVGDWGRKPSTSRTVCTEPCTASKLANARIRAGKRMIIEKQYNHPISKKRLHFDSKKWCNLIKLHIDNADYSIYYDKCNLVKLHIRRVGWSLLD